MTIEQYKKELDEMQSYTDTESSDNPEEYAERIRVLDAYYSRSGKIWVDAQSLYNKQLKRGVLEVIQQLTQGLKLSAKMQDTLARSHAEEEQELVTYAERVHRICLHQAEHFRSLLSSEREHLRLAKTGY